jgi:hypothetical protein
VNSSGRRPWRPCLFVLRRLGDLSEELKNPIPSRTRPLNSSAPMVLCLKTRESRSLPGLPRTNNASHDIDNTNAALTCLRRRVCLCGASSAFEACFEGPIAAGWSSPVARQAHNLKVTGSNPVPATKHQTHTARPPTQKCSGALLCSGQTMKTEEAKALVSKTPRGLRRPGSTILQQRRNRSSNPGTSEPGTAAE